MRSQAPRRDYSRASASVCTPPTKSSSYKVEDHFLVVDGPTGKVHMCREMGCSKTFKLKTSATHKKEHSAMHNKELTRTPFRSMIPDRQTSIIVRFLASTGSPFSTVENSYFRFMTGTRTSRKLVSLKSKELATKQRQEMLMKLSSIKSVSLTMDIWTSIAVKPYICFTVHYVDSHGSISNELLHFKFIEPPHTGSCIRARIEEVLDEYNLADKVFAITADGAKNEDAGIRQLNTLRGMRGNLPIKRLYCVAHLINNVVDDGLKDLDPTIEKVRNITFCIRLSPSMTSKLRQLQIDAHRRPLMVVKDVRTRWNSTYMMIERYFKLESFIAIIVQGEGALSSFALSSSETVALRDFMDVLKPLKLLTDFFSCNRKENLGAVVHLYRELVDKLQHQAIANIGGDMPNRLLHALRKREDKFVNSTTLLAAGLDPRWKSSTWLERSELISAFSDALEASNGREEDETTTRNNSSAESELFSVFSQPSQEIVQEESIDAYLDDKSVCSIGYFSWWKINQLRYPKLYNLAMNFLPIRSTSVASEAKFSIAGNLIGTRRSQLDDDSVEAIMHLNSNENVLIPDSSLTFEPIEHEEVSTEDQNDASDGEDMMQIDE